MKRWITIAVPNDQEAIEDVARFVEKDIQRWRLTPNTERQILRAIVNGLRGVKVETVQGYITREEALGHLKDLGFSRKEAEKELDSKNKETLEELDERLDPTAKDVDKNDLMVTALLQWLRANKEVVKWLQREA